MEKVGVNTDIYIVIVMSVAIAPRNVAVAPRNLAMAPRNVAVFPRNVAVAPRNLAITILHMNVFCPYRVLIFITLVKNHLHLKKMKNHHIMKMEMILHLMV